MGIFNAPFDATFIICFVSLNPVANLMLPSNSLKHFLHVLFPDSSSNENRLFLAHPHPVFRFCSLQRSDLCSANRLCQLLSPAGYILKRKHLQKTMHLPHAACWDTEDRFKGLEIHLLWPLSSHTDRTTSRTKHQGGKKPSLTRQGCQCTNITAQHFVLAASEPYPPLGSRFTSCLKAFSNGNVLLIMQSLHSPHN